MTERLSRKLGEIHDAAQAGAQAAQKPCLEVDERWGFSAEFHPVPGTALVLPYSQFSQANWSEKKNALTLVFVSCEIRIEGARLEAVKAAIGSGRNAVIRAMPAGLNDGDLGDIPFISVITIIPREVREQKGDKPAGKAASK